MKRIEARLKVLKATIEFDGTSGKGELNTPLEQKCYIESGCDLHQIVNGDFIQEVFYKVTEPLVTADSANTYIEAGFKEKNKNGDFGDYALNSTTGIIDTLNSNSSGKKLEPDYTSAVKDTVLNFIPKGSSPITGGVIEFYISVIGL